MRIQILAAIAGLALLVLSAGSSDATGDLKMAMEPFTVSCPPGPMTFELEITEVPSGWYPVHQDIHLNFFKVGAAAQASNGQWQILCSYGSKTDSCFRCGTLVKYLTATSCTIPPTNEDGSNGPDVTCYRPAKVKTKPKPKPTP